MQCNTNKTTILCNKGYKTKAMKNIVLNINRTYNNSITKKRSPGMNHLLKPSLSTDIELFLFWYIYFAKYFSFTCFKMFWGTRQWPETEHKISLENE